jgi:hypothetical protein
MTDNHHDISRSTNEDAAPDQTDRRQTGPPAARPCGTCPYRRDVPSGVWDASEYEKLPRYDAPTPFQPTNVFVCHLADQKRGLYRICAGWAGCHDGYELLSLRIAVSDSVAMISPRTYDLTAEYQSPVPLFASGAEAAAHGMRDIETPDQTATVAIEKILRVRPDIVVPGATRRTRTHIDPPKEEQ